VQLSARGFIMGRFSATITSISILRRLARKPETGGLCFDVQPGKVGPHDEVACTPCSVYQGA
jgi:hypothetical protein